MKTYALIENGIVINTIVWAGPDEVPMDFGKNVSFHEIPDEEGATPSIGWKFEDGLFISPPPTPVDEEEKKQSIIKSNIATKQYLLETASMNINILQDAVDLEIATDSEIKLLPIWKKYRVLVNRVDANTSDEITWPEAPAS